MLDPIELKDLPVTLETLAKRAYHAYGSVTDHKNYQGLPMPEWDDLPPKIRAAWCAAANQVDSDTRS